MGVLLKAGIKFTNIGGMNIDKSVVEEKALNKLNNKFTVLVVEDSPTTRKVIKMTLQKGCFRVKEAADGVEALSKLNYERPNLVLLDVMLPKVDGYNILDDDKYILRERRQMSFEGLATVTLGVDFRNKSISFGPLLHTRGIVDDKLQPEVISSVISEVERSLSRKFKNGRINDPLEAEEVMRQAVRRAFGRERGRKPVTIPLVVEVNEQ